MRSRWTSRLASPLLALSIASCRDSTGPGAGDLVELLLDFCATETPSFFAVQNEGGQWTRVSPDAFGTFAFEATEKVGLAIIHQDGSGFSSEYIFAARSDLEPMSSRSCAEQSGVKDLSGTVANLPPGSAAMISMAGQFDYLTAPSTAYSLPDLPSGPLDLIAHREVVGVTDVVPDRIIVRRAQDRTNGSSIPLLDFASTEAQPLTTHSFTASGVSANEDNYFLLSFSTNTTKDHSLSDLGSFTSGSQSLYGVPGGLTQAGDLHELDVFADAGSSYRGESQYYRLPTSRTVALGPALNVPTVSTVATAPLRLRTQLVSQSQYGSLMSVFYQQGTTRRTVVTQTSAFTGGTPATWDVTIPNLTGVSGFPAGSSLQSGTQTDWFVDAYGGAGASVFFGTPTDGAVLRYAGRTAVAATMQMRRMRGAESGPSIRAGRRALGAF